MMTRTPQAVVGRGSFFRVEQGKSGRPLDLMWRRMLISTILNYSPKGVEKSRLNRVRRRQEFNGMTSVLTRIFRVSSLFVGAICLMVAGCVGVPSEDLR